MLAEQSIKDIIRVAIDDANHGRADSNVISPAEIRAADAKILAADLEARRLGAERAIQDEQISIDIFSRYFALIISSMKQDMPDFDFQLGHDPNINATVASLTFGEPKRLGWRREAVICVVKQKIIIQAKDYIDYDRSSSPDERATKLEIADITQPGEIEKAARHIALLAAEGPELPKYRKNVAAKLTP